MGTEDQNAMDRPCPSPPTRAQCNRAEPQEPTWRRVMPNATLQKVEPQEPALKDKGKGKLVDVTTIASSSTSTISMPEVSKTKWVVRPKVVTQEPTKGKTNYHNEKSQHTQAKTEPQEPTSAKGVEPQEPDNARNEEADILQDTKSMLKDFAQSVFATIAQVHIPQAITVSAKRYATWVFNALP